MVDFVITANLLEEQMTFLKDHFSSLCMEVKVPQEQIEVLWNELVRCYSEPHRAYHNLSHLFNLLKLYDDYQERIKNKVAFRIAIWWHDIIYDVQKKDNEFVSAAKAVEVWNSCLSTAELKLMDDMIKSTAGHKPLSENPDLLLFLDMDLSVLAANNSIYMQYSNAVWQEYATVYSKELYCIGRKKAMENFLCRESLFLTSFFSDECEDKARRNIVLELQTL